MKFHRSGQLLIELLLAISIASIVLPTLFSMVIASREGNAQQEQRVKASALARETEEVVRSVREIGWDQFALYPLQTPLKIQRQGNVWSLVPGTETVQGFTRTIRIESVNRDATGAVVTTGGTLDPSSRKILNEVSWSTPFTTSVETSVLLTRHTNIKKLFTTDTDFAPGVLTHVAIRKIIDGEIMLGSTGGKGDWCAPSLSIAAVDLPKSGVANAIAAIPGNVIAGTGENASGVSFANILVADTNPPTSSISGTFDGYKTNGVFNESHYAYLATDNNGKEVVIIDLTQQDPVTKKYSEVGYFDAPGNKKGKSVAVAGNIGFVTVDNVLYTFDLSGKIDSRPQLASKTLAGNGTKVVINGFYAFVAIDESAPALQIIQFSSDGKTLTITGSASVDGQGASDVVVNGTGTRAYLATEQDGSKPEFFIIDTSSKDSTRSAVGSYDSNGMNPKAVAVVTSSKAILGGTGGEEYQVIEITDEAHPSRCNGLNIDSGVHGIAAAVEADYDAYAYIITGDASSELKIIEGGPGADGKDYFLTGSYDSPVYDVQALATGSAQAVFNNISATTVQSTGPTEAKLQFAAGDAVSGSCQNASYVYVGPDGTNGSYFMASANGSITSAIPFSNDNVGFENPARCFRYRAFLSTTDTSLAPQVQDVTISFSP
jgi:hypothetical protein